MQHKFLTASANPLDDINQIAYEGQPLERRMYHDGYEHYFEGLPVLGDGDELLNAKIQMSKTIMKLLAHKLTQDPWAQSMPPLAGGFNRTILGMEQPVIHPDGAIKEGSEIVLARWGDGHASPIHGHAAGYLHEELLFGKMRVNTYRIVDHENRIVRPLQTAIYSQPGTIAAMYTNQNTNIRSALVHNFTSIGYSGTLHYLPEHTRDGRDNKFNVQYFGPSVKLNPDDFTQITAQQGLDLKIGDVALVRSQNVPDYGDHYIVITGRPVLKEHGLRPQEIAIHAPNWTEQTMLDMFEPIMGLTLLKLDESAKSTFYEFHGITLKDNQVLFS